MEKDYKSLYEETRLELEQAKKEKDILKSQLKLQERRIDILRKLLSKKERQPHLIAGFED